MSIIWLMPLYKINTMEDSLFNRPINVGQYQQQQVLVNEPVANVNSSALLSALIQQGVARHIKHDPSAGKIDILNRLVPKTKNLRRLLTAMQEEGDEIMIKGADDAVDVLEVIYGIATNKFGLGETPAES
nr:P12 [Darna trima granulovirus]